MSKTYFEANPTSKTHAEDLLHTIQDTWDQIINWDHRKHGVSPTFLFFSPSFILIFFALIAHCPECSTRFSIFIFGALGIHAFLKLTRNPISSTLHYQILYSCVLAFSLLSFSPALPYDQAKVLLAVLFPLYYHTLTASVSITILISIPIFLFLLFSSLQESFSSSTLLVVMIVVPTIFWTRTRDMPGQTATNLKMKTEDSQTKLSKKVSSDPSEDVALQRLASKGLEKQASDSGTEENEKVILGISHDCRNLLNSLKGILTLMKDEENGDDTYTVKDDNLQSAIAISEHLSLLFTNLLDYLKKNEDVNTQGELRLTSTLEKIWLMISANLKKKNLGGSITIKNGTPLLVHLDERKFMGILLNIVGNAVKFTDTGHIKINVHWRENHQEPESPSKHGRPDAHANLPLPGEVFRKPEFSPIKSEVGSRGVDMNADTDLANLVLSKTTFFDMRDIDSISFSKKCFTAISDASSLQKNNRLREGSLIVTVRDTGCGIDEENLKKLFKKYGQVGEDPEKNKLGLGLGLWYTKYLLNKLNGKIDFRSTKNVGTWVKIEIPCKVVQKTHSEQNLSGLDISSQDHLNQPVPQPRFSYHEQKASIFVREDDRLANLLVSEYLKKHGSQAVEVVEVKSVSEILKSDKLRYTNCVFILGESSATRQEIHSLKRLLEHYNSEKSPIILLKDAETTSRDKVSGWGDIEAAFAVKKPIRKQQLDEIANNVDNVLGRKVVGSSQQDKSKDQMPHILIVDDDDISRMYLRRQLEKNNFSCLEAKDGQEAVEVYKRESANIELIFMDSQMPKMNGLEATRAIRSLARDPKLSIFGLTGMDTQEFKEAAICSGMNEVFLKPIPFEKLIQVVNKTIGAR